MKNLIVTATVVFGVMAIVLLLVLLNRSDDGAPVRLPDVANVEKVTAKVDDLRAAMGLDPVPEFEIPREYFEAVLSALSPAEKSQFARGFKVSPLGELTIRTKSGPIVALVFFHSGVNPLCFSVDGIDSIRGGPFEPLMHPTGEGNFHGDEGLLFAGLMKEIYQETLRPTKERKDLKRRIEQLEISRGVRPPQPPLTPSR